MSSSTESIIKYAGELTLTPVIPEEYERYLESQELVRGLSIQFLVSFTNGSSRSFPGCTLKVLFDEYGESATPLSWILSTPLSVKRLRRGESWSGEFRFPPLTNGLMRIRVQVESVKGKGGQPGDLELRGYRSLPGSTFEVYYHVIPRESLDIQRKLDLALEYL